jgi:hypothetical protein
LYEPAERIRDRNVEPGDIVVVGTHAGGPGHLMLVGPQPNTLWHCTESSGACMSGWGLPAFTSRVFAVYRILDKDRWVF